MKRLPEALSLKVACGGKIASAAICTAKPDLNLAKQWLRQVRMLHRYVTVGADSASHISFT